MNNMSLWNISRILYIPKSTCNDIYRHAVKNLKEKYRVHDDHPSPQTHLLPINPSSTTEAQLQAPSPIVLGPAAFEPQELMLLELLTPECLDANRNIGRP